MTQSDPLAVDASLQFVVNLKTKTSNRFSMNL